MRPDLVVMSSPNLDQNLSLLAAAEPLEAEAFISKLVVETLVGSVLPRFPRIDGGGQRRAGGEGRQAGRLTGTGGPGVHAGRCDRGATVLKRIRLATALIAIGRSIGSAGVGLDRSAEAAYTDLDCSSVSPAALYGGGRGGDGARYRSVGDFGTAPVLELGLGYAAASAVRLEVVAEYRPRFAFDGRAKFSETGRRQSVAADLSLPSTTLNGGRCACPGIPGPWIHLLARILHKKRGQALSNPF